MALGEGMLTTRSASMVNYGYAQHLNFSDVSSLMASVLVCYELHFVANL